VTTTHMLVGLLVLQLFLIVMKSITIYFQDNAVRFLKDANDKLSTELNEADMRLSITMTAQREHIKRIQEDFDTRTRQMREKIALYEGLHGEPIPIPTKSARL
jgi:hypothetical protein